RPAAGGAGRGGRGCGRRGRSLCTVLGLGALRGLVGAVAAVVAVSVGVVAVVPVVLAAAVRGAGAGRAFGLVVLLRAGEVLHRGGDDQLGAVLALQRQLHLVAGPQRGGEVHEHEVVPAGLEHELAAVGDGEAALLLLHAHAAGAVAHGLV